MSHEAGFLDAPLIKELLKNLRLEICFYESFEEFEDAIKIS